VATFADSFHWKSSRQPANIRRDLRRTVVGFIRQQQIKALCCGEIFQRTDLPARPLLVECPGGVVVFGGNDPRWLGCRRQLGCVHLGITWGGLPDCCRDCGSCRLNVTRQASAMLGFQIGGFGVASAASVYSIPTRWMGGRLAMAAKSWDRLGIYHRQTPHPGNAVTSKRRARHC